MIASLSRSAVLVLAFAPIGLARAQSPAELRRRVEAVLAKNEAASIELRRDLHRHPELSGSEERTAGIVAARLQSLGLEVRTGVGGHGVVALLRGGRPGPTVAFRADMDAFPSTDRDPVEFRSEVTGVRHICGHDIHTTVGLALAAGLAAVRADLPGTVMFVFQPAEERATGANAMIADRVFDAVKPVAIFAVHTAPFPVGQLATAAGPMMATRDFVRVTIAGPGELGRVADSARTVIEGVATLPASAALAPAPEGFVFAQVRPARPDGAGRVVVEGSLTLVSPAARRTARDAVESRLRGLSSDGVTVTTAYQPRAIAGVTNDSGLVRESSASIDGALGAGTVVPLTQIIPAFSEDFGAFEDHVPGAFYFLGVANAGKGWAGQPHSPDYVADEAAILVGARAMTAAILGRLVRQKAS